MKILVHVGRSKHDHTALHRTGDAVTLTNNGHPVTGARARLDPNTHIESECMVCGDPIFRETKLGPWFHGRFVRRP